MIDAKELPAADTIINYGDAGYGPLFLHWAPEGADVTHAAREAGFDCRFAVMEQELAEDDPLFVAYFEAGETHPIKQWVAPKFDGWKQVGQWDTEDGPVAFYVRPARAGSDDTEGTHGKFGDSKYGVVI